MLRVQNLSVDVEGSRVLRGISFDVKAGELIYLVGRNGAGKTTSLRTIMGFRKPAAGSLITFEGVNLAGLRPYRIARLGIGFAPEESEVFGELTVAENIALPTWTQAHAREAQARIEEAYRVFPQLERYHTRGGHALSGGERKMVSIARALALGPKLLLLDEPPISAPSATRSSSPSPTSTMCRISPTGSTSSSGARSCLPGCPNWPPRTRRWRGSSPELRRAAAGTRLKPRPRCDRCVIYQMAHLT